MTEPSAERFGLARRSRISACSRIASSSLSRPVFFSAETWHVLGFAAHLLDHDVVAQQFLTNPVRIGVRLVHLVDGDDDRRIGRLGVTDRLDRLRHDTVIGGNHQNDDIGDRGAARAHRGERLMARRVDEGDPVAGRQVHLIGADMLGDAAGLARRHIGRAQRVEQRGLAVVDMAHDGDHRRPHEQIGIDIGQRLPGRSRRRPRKRGGHGGQTPAPPVPRYRHRASA